MTRMGAILAGGRSSRFGSDKALALLAGEPLLAHAARAIQGHVSEIVVCGRDAPIAGMLAVADWPKPDLGPLGGLCGALRYAAAHGYAQVLSIGCDMPVLPKGLIDRLIASDPSGYAMEAPILGCWPSAWAGALEDHLLCNDDRSIRRWAASMGGTPIHAGQAIINVNRPGDMAYVQFEHGDAADADRGN